MASNMNNILSRKGFPYSFSPEACKSCNGRCCSTERPGFLMINDQEISTITTFLGITSEELKRDYLRPEDGFLNIKDIKINGKYSCVFLDTENGRCAIYEARPKQCREFPFWECCKNDYKLLRKECPGVMKQKP